MNTIVFQDELPLAYSTIDELEEEFRNNGAKNIKPVDLNTCVAAIASKGLFF